MDNKQIMRFTSLRGSNNAKIEKDSDGYYAMHVGALNAIASDGAFYEYTNEVKKLFEGSGLLMMRLKRGFLKAEVTHPKHEPGMSLNEYKERIASIDYNQVCAHISEIWLEEDSTRTNKHGKQVNIFAKVKPHGPQAKVLEDALEDPNMNVAFSLRCFVDESWSPSGELIKTVTYIVTWDLVIEPGIDSATKWATVGLESKCLAVLDLSNANEVKDFISGFSKQGVGLESDNNDVINFIKDKVKDETKSVGSNSKIYNW